MSSARAIPAQIALTLALTWASVTSATACADSPPVAPRAASGAELFAKYCALCHGASGEGYAADRANALSNQDFLAAADDAFLVDSVAYGRPGTAMAAYSGTVGGPLGAEEIQKIVKYISAWRTQPRASLPAPAGGDAERGRVAYLEHCATCHGQDGTGKTGPSLANPRLLHAASDAFLRHAIARGRRGTPMRGYESDLGPLRVDDLVRFLRSWAKPVAEPPVAALVPLGDIVIHPDGERPSFELRDARFVSAAEVKHALDQNQRIILLDARASSDWLLGHIPGALSAPYYRVDEIAAHLPKDGTWIVAYCACPHAASGQVIDDLRKRGFENTAVLDEGIGYWAAQGWPIATP